jgi:hypothetical protein
MIKEGCRFIVLVVVAVMIVVVFGLYRSWQQENYCQHCGDNLFFVSLHLMLRGE